MFQKRAKEKQMQIYDNLFSNDKEIIHKTLKEIELISDEEYKSLIDLIFNNYNPENKNNIKITIRALNKCIWRDQSIEFIKKYGYILLQNVTHLDGYTRMIVYSVMDSFRLFLLNVHNKKSSAEKASYSVNFYVKLSEFYEANKDEKIRASILSCLSRFNCAAFSELISTTKYKNIYEKFNHLSYMRRYKYNEY